MPRPFMEGCGCAATVGFAGAPPLCPVTRWAGMQTSPRPVDSGRIAGEEGSVYGCGWMDGWMEVREWGAIKLNEEGMGVGWKMETNSEWTNPAVSGG